MKILLALLTGMFAGCGAAVPAKPTMQMLVQPQPTPVIVFSRKPEPAQKPPTPACDAKQWKAYAQKLERLLGIATSPTDLPSHENL